MLIDNINTDTLTEDEKNIVALTKVIGHLNDIHLHLGITETAVLAIAEGNPLLSVGQSAEARLELIAAFIRDRKPELKALQDKLTRATEDVHV